MMDAVDALVRLFTGFFKALHPRNLRRVAAELPLYAPLAVRSVRRRLLRNLLVGLSLGAGMIVFLGLSATFGGTAADMAGKTRDLTLPADIVALGIGGAKGRPVDDLQWVAQAGAYESFDRWQAATSLGTRWVVGLAPGGRLAAAPSLGSVSLPGPGEILVPAALARAAGLAPGAAVEVGRVGPSGWAGRSFRVSALLETGDAVLGDALVVNLSDSLGLRAELESALGPAPGEPGAAAGPNAVAVWAREPGDEGRLLSRVRSLFPGATVWWPGFPAAQAAAAVGGFLSPGNVILALVFVLAGLGVFNVLLLTLLQRKVQLGVLKALGAANDEVFLLLLLEGALTALGGMALGLGGGVALVRLLDRASEIPLVLPFGSVVWSILLAVTSFYLAAWLPATLCRRAAPVQLMAGRRLYLNPRSTCAQCGRCGGF